MAHPSVERGPFLTVRWGRNVVWFKTWLNAGRLTVWTRWLAFSVGRRGPLHDGWPE